MTFQIGTIEMEVGRVSITSTGTRAQTPEEVLESLDKLGIESYLTESGDLYIKSWQVAAEGFVTPEVAAVIRRNRPSPDRGHELEWLSKNLENIRQRYSGQWIAIYGNEVIASDETLSDLMRRITEYDNPFLTFIPRNPVVWTFTYANKRI